MVALDDGSHHLGGHGSGWKSGSGDGFPSPKHGQMQRGRWGGACGDLQLAQAWLNGKLTDDSFSGGPSRAREATRELGIKENVAKLITGDNAAALRCVGTGGGIEAKGDSMALTWHALQAETGRGISARPSRRESHWQPGPTLILNFKEFANGTQMLNFKMEKEIISGPKNLEKF
jgi:hypothetical protein